MNGERHEWQRCEGFVAFVVISNAADLPDHIEIRKDSAKMWKFLLDAEPTPSDVAELIDHADTLEQAKWLAQIAASAETFLEHARYDLMKFGEIGVSF